MDDKKKEMTQEEAEEDFKNAVADIFSKQIPGTHKDSDGYLVVPLLRRKKRDCKPDKH